MTTSSFQTELDARIAQFDLLTHPFYQSWSMGALKRDEIKEYACDYYHHVAEFPAYLATFMDRLPEGKVKELVADNKADEEGAKSADRKTHAAIWLDFVTGMGGTKLDAVGREPIAEISELMETYHSLAATGTTAEALAAFYAYESQVPRVAAEKERGLVDLYGADKQTAYYFTLHKSFDLQHSRSWLEKLEEEVASNPAAREQALSAAETSARALWRVLDGVEARRRRSAA
jgi:pyrroloquinoline-quinone synthase